jgi:hypothetical protein
MVEIDTIIIPPIKLEWSEWIPWENIKKDGRKEDGISIPNKKSGVYEAKLIDKEERLTIGSTDDLRYRIRQCLVKGISQHSSGDEIRRKEDINKIVVRWAKTDKPRAVEEELHQRHVETFRYLPKYTKRT